jgi:hypothetical protein
MSTLDDQTEQTKEDRAILETIAGHAVKGEIAAWNRKRKSIERIITNNIHPLEQKLIELNAQLMPLYDELKSARSAMIEFCIHPIDMLVKVEGHVECKFCDAKMVVPAKAAE